MLFNSQIFILIFLPLTLLLYYQIAQSNQTTHRVYFLLFASLIFYGYWDIRFVPLLLASVTANWALGIISIKLRMKSILIIGILANILFLSYFKYLNFIFETLASFREQTWELREIILPLGISFFTFQNIA